METIKSRLAAGKMVRVFSIGQLACPKIIEIAALNGGYHAVWIDQEHAALDLPTIETLALACRSVGLDSYVRLAPTDYATVMRPMEAGISGIMAAQIRTVADAKQVVEWGRFPPLGVRGLNTSNYEGKYGTANLAEHVARCEATTWISLQIETAEAVENVEAIAAVPGVDHLFVGPADLSLALGVPGQFLHERCKQALKRVSQAVAKVGKSWGILVRGPEHAEFCQQLGCRFFAFASDLSLVHAGFNATRNQYQSFFADGA